MYIYVGFPTTYRQSLVFGLPGKIKDSKLKLQTSELQLFFWMCFIQTKRKIQKVRPKKKYISCSNRSCFWKFLGRNKKKTDPYYLKGCLSHQRFPFKKSPVLEVRMTSIDLRQGKPGVSSETRFVGRTRNTTWAWLLKVKMPVGEAISDIPWIPWKSKKTWFFGHSEFWPRVVYGEDDENSPMLEVIFRFFFFITPK